MTTTNPASSPTEFGAFGDAAAALADRGEAVLRMMETELRTELGDVLPQDVDSALDRLSDLFGDMRALAQAVAP